MSLKGWIISLVAAGGVSTGAVTAVGAAAHAPSAQPTTTTAPVATAQRLDRQVASLRQQETDLEAALASARAAHEARLAAERQASTAPPPAPAAAPTTTGPVAPNAANGYWDDGTGDASEQGDGSRTTTSGTAGQATTTGGDSGATSGTSGRDD